MSAVAASSGHALALSVLSEIPAEEMRGPTHGRIHLFMSNTFQLESIIRAGCEALRKDAKLMRAVVEGGGMAEDDIGNQLMMNTTAARLAAESMEAQAKLGECFLYGLEGSEAVILTNYEPAKEDETQGS